MERWLFPVLTPLAAALFVVVVAGGLGGIFTLTGENGAIVIGMGLVLGVPLVGWYLVRR